MSNNVEVANLSKSFGNNEVLTNISFEIDAGSVVALLGQSGSGKSTVLRCIAGLERPDSGDIAVGGITLDPKRGKQVRIGMVFQQFHLYPHMTAKENVTVALRHVQRRRRAQADDIALTELRRVGLEPFAERYPLQLSGGQQQRVAIARALALNPEILLFDEPTSALDPEMTGEVLAVMRALAHGGMTMMVATHEMEFARDVADLILFMDNGEVVELSPPAKFFTNPSSSRAQKFLSRMLKE